MMCPVPVEGVDGPVAVDRRQLRQAVLDGRPRRYDRFVRSVEPGEFLVIARS
jgi:hypothetical protein